MSEILEILLEVVFNTIGCILEILGDAWLPEITWPDTKASRIILGLIIAILAAIIFCEIR